MTTVHWIQIQIQKENARKKIKIVMTVIKK